MRVRVCDKPGIMLNSLKKKLEWVQIGSFYHGFWKTPLKYICRVFNNVVRGRVFCRVFKDLINDLNFF